MYKSLNYKYLNKTRSEANLPLIVCSFYVFAVDVFQLVVFRTPAVNSFS